MPQVEDSFETQFSKTEIDKTCVKRCLLWNLKKKVRTREEARVGVGVYHGERVLPGSVSGI